MQVQPILNGLRASLESQRSLAGGDASIDDAVVWLTEALGPALRIAALDLAQQAAVEVAAQLADCLLDAQKFQFRHRLLVEQVAAPHSEVEVAGEHLDLGELEPAVGDEVVVGADEFVVEDQVPNVAEAEPGSTGDV